jgi:hypothetical protein
MEALTGACPSCAVRIKQFDRFLSNRGIDVDKLRPEWARFVLGGRNEALFALDWTNYDADDHATLSMYVVTPHGRATPLAWQTVKKSELAGQRTTIEQAFVEKVHAAIPPEVNITLLADRGFGDQVLYEVLELLGWSFVIRFRGSILVEHDGIQQPASQWLSSSGRARKLASAKVTADRTHVGAVVIARANAPGHRAGRPHAARRGLGTLRHGRLPPCQQRQTSNPLAPSPGCVLVQLSAHDARRLVRAVDGRVRCGAGGTSGDHHAAGRNLRGCFRRRAPQASPYVQVPP